ncbi:MAG: hypothetical protein ABFC89_06745 [Methanospirillum sp.]
MMFVVTLVHTPEMCLARKEFAPEFRRWFEGMDDLAKSLGIRVHDVYSCPTEHTFYFILEAGEYRDITTFFAGIMLSNHTGRVSPVISLREAAEILIK